MILPLLVTLLVGIHAETAADLANRLVSLGEIFVTKTEAQNVLQCFEGSVYQQQSTDKLLLAITQCLQKNIPNTKFINAMTTVLSYGSCIKPSGDSLPTFLIKVYNGAKSFIIPPLTKFNTSITTWKKSGLSQDKAISKGYKMLLNNVAKAGVINKICTNIVQNNFVNKVQWSCFLKYAAKFVTLSKYNCTKMQPTV